MMSAETGGQQGFVEVDPSGRYGRYNQILGKGSSKIVYKAFDEYDGIEVAWNQVKLHDFLQSPEDLERLYCEIHLLKTLKHRNIMKFYTSWVDTSNRNINFVTEMFTSGTLRQYRQKHRRVNIRAVKNWCRQILSGLLYLHSHDPPVIHRDLKCDNIFINGNQGQVKIGDLGLAAILKKSHADHCVGTPEFMAPEVYQEQYNELVDIYSFGMCILEMVTFEYPYSECTHPAQIYKKVTSGTKPDALYKVRDPEIRKFVEKCLAPVSRRLTARELLKDPFLRIDGVSPTSMHEVGYVLPPVPRQPSFTPHTSTGYLMATWFSDGAVENGWGYDNVEATPHEEIELFSNHEDDHLPNVDITIKGKRKSDGSIYLKLRIMDREGLLIVRVLWFIDLWESCSISLNAIAGRRRNIHFPFDIEVDTALNVATEMVAEVDIVDFDVISIAEMIDGEVASLVPEWIPGPGFEDRLGYSTPQGFCDNSASAVTSYGSLSEILSGKNPSNLQDTHCSRVGCMHGRFAEVTYQLQALSEQNLAEEPLLQSCEACGPDGSQATESEAEKEGQSPGLEIGRGTEATAQENLEISTSISEKLPEVPEGVCQQCAAATDLGEDYEGEIQRELGWLKAKYQMELGEYMKKQMEGAGKPVSPQTFYDLGKLPSDVEMLRQFDLQREVSFNTESPQSDASTVVDNGDESFGEGSFHSMHSQGIGSHVSSNNSGDCLFSGKKYYACNLLPSCLSGTKSLPVDAIDT